MTRPNYLNFSRLEGRDVLNTLVDEAASKLMNILNAPHAAKENLMKTDYKAAVAAANVVKTLVQAESANLQAMTVLATRIEGSDNLRAFIDANMPQINVAKRIGAGK